MPTPIFGGSLSGTFDHGLCHDDNAETNVFFKSYLATLAASAGAFSVSLINGTTHAATGIETIADDVLTVTTADGFDMLFISDIRNIASAIQPPVVICNGCGC